MHTIEAVIDRFVVRKNAEEAEDAPSLEEMRQRLTDSVETALKLGGGIMIVSDISDRDNPKDRTFSEHFACVKCGTSLGEIELGPASNVTRLKVRLRTTEQVPKVIARGWDWKDKKEGNRFEAHGLRSLCKMALARGAASGLRRTIASSA